MSDLIISGIDHGKFDLEWAKRGGVVLIIMDDSQSKILANLAKYVGEWAYFINTTRYSIPDCELYLTCGLSGSSDLETSSDTHYVERMATPSECAEAGIEYIEPPARWFPIDSAPSGQPLLVWSCAYDGYIEIAIKHWSDSMWYHDIHLLPFEPTHWQPLPQPPKDE